MINVDETVSHLQRVLSDIRSNKDYKFQYYMNRNDCDKMKNNFYRKFKDKQDTYFLRMAK